MSSPDGKPRRRPSDAADRSRRGSSQSSTGRGRPGENARRRSRESKEKPARVAQEPAAHLSDDIVRELESTARPGKGGILVQVFSEAAAALATGPLADGPRPALERAFERPLAQVERDWRGQLDALRAG